MRENAVCKSIYIVCSSGAVLYASYNISLEKGRADSTFSIKFLLNFWGFPTKNQGYESGYDSYCLIVMSGLQLRQK